MPNPAPEQPSERPLRPPGQHVIPCSKNPKFAAVLRQYISDLRKEAHSIGSHGLRPEEFQRSGLFEAAIESIRGTQSATMEEKRAFIGAALSYLRDQGLVADWDDDTARGRFDYRVNMPDEPSLKIAFEAKGCLDGNNTTIYERPSDAGEFYIWSLCQNAGSDPRKNAWSGTHTRLGAEMLSRAGHAKRVDGLIIWDMRCNTVSRPCPKIIADPSRATRFSSQFPAVPPPCIYLFPSFIPEVRHSPTAQPVALRRLRFMSMLAEAFGIPASEIYGVQYEVRWQGNEQQRRTTLVLNDRVVAESKWTLLKRD